MNITEKLGRLKTAAAIVACMLMTAASAWAGSKFYYTTSNGEKIADDVWKKLGEVACQKDAEGKYCVEFKNCVTSLPNDAFRDCASLASINIPEGVERIGQYAFASCVSLASVTIGKGTKVIEIGAFCACTALQDANLPEGLESIGEDAFYRCQALQEIAIPKSVTSIGYWAFQDCANLSEARYLGTNEPKYDAAFPPFERCPKLKAVSVPAEYSGKKFCGSVIVRTPSNSTAQAMASIPPHE